MAPAARAARVPRKPLIGAAVTASILCLAPGFTAATAATAAAVHSHPAKPGRAHSTPGQPGAPAPAPAPPASPTGRQQAPGAQGEGGSQPQPSAQGRHKHRHDPRGGEGSTREGSATGSSGGGSGSGEAGAPEAQVPGAAQGGASAQRARRPRAHHNRPKESKRGLATPHAPAAPAAAAVAASAPAAVPAAVAPSVAPASSAAATPAVAATPAATAKPQASSGSPSRRSHARRRGAAPAPRATLAAPSAAGTVSVAATPTPAPAKRQPARHASPARSSESPLVKTVTRIINVVPPLMRVLIVGLIALALALAASSRLVALRARRLARQRQQLLEDVGLLQTALLPPLPARLGPVGTSAAYRPASGPGAGGDFYDVFALGDGQLAVIVGDVSGHGREALPHTTLVRFTLRAYLEAGLSPRAALQTAAPVLERQLGDSFATVVLATYNPRERVLVYACAGHPPPLVLGTDSIVPITVCSAPPIGVGHPTGTRQSTVSIPGSALACFYTDGVIEARVSGTLFGVDRLESVLAGLGAEATALTLLDRVAEECDRRPDDMAACLLRMEGQPAAPLVQVEELELDGRDLGGDRAERFLLAGGVHPAEVSAAVAATRRALTRHGRVVLEAHVGEEEPRIVVRPQNVATLQPPPSLEAATARGGSR